MSDKFTLVKVSAKKPEKTLKEKRAAKQAKRAMKG